MPQHLTPVQTARAIAKLEENWSSAAVGRELHCNKTCIFNIKRRWQENRLHERQRIHPNLSNETLLNGHDCTMAAKKFWPSLS
jgi:hypothetical protein